MCVMNTTYGKPGKIIFYKLLLHLCAHDTIDMMAKVIYEIIGRAHFSFIDSVWAVVCYLKDTLPPFGK